MWHVIAQSGLASAGVDFTDSLSLLVAGLVSLVWLSAGLIAVLAVHHHWSGSRRGCLKQPLALWTTRRRRNEVARHKRNSLSQGESYGDGAQCPQTAAEENLMKEIKILGLLNHTRTLDNVM